MIDLMEEKEVYLADFSAFEKDLGDRVSVWPHSLRAVAIERFAELGFPTPRDEDWKFTSLAPLAEIPFKLAPLASGLTAEDLRPTTILVGAVVRLVFVNGRLAPALSTQGALPGGVVVTSLATALEQHRALVEPHLARLALPDYHAFTALNTAFLRDGAFVHVPRGVVLREPVQLVFVSTAPDEPTVAHPRTLIVAEDNSQLTFTQGYLGVADEVYFTNAVTEVVAGANAFVDHYKLQREVLRAFHLETLRIRLDRGSNFSSHAVTLGGGWVRNEVGAVFTGEGAECTLNGLYLADGTQHVDNRTVIDHAKAHCASHELYKGILDGKAHGVFNGKIYVRQDAQKTDAKQTNQTLLLSEDAVIDTKPQLEIFADDVKCTHGATVGQLSADALFYLRARGLGLEEARSLLTYAFANDVLDRMKLEPLRRRLEDLLLARHRLPGVKEVS